MIRSQKATYRRAVCKRLERILANEFTTPTLITLQCSSAVRVPQALAKKIFSNWKYQAQRVTSRPFKYIKIIDYGSFPLPGIVFYVIADLPVDLSQKICDAWYMGRATAALLDASGFDKVADSIMRQDLNDMGVHPRMWSYCARSLQSTTAPLAQ